MDQNGDVGFGIQIRLSSGTDVRMPTCSAFPKDVVFIETAPLTEEEFALELVFSRPVKIADPAAKLSLYGTRTIDGTERSYLP